MKSEIDNGNSASTNDLRDKVRAGYAQIARTGVLAIAPQGGGCCGNTGCCDGLSPDELARKIGYGVDEIKSLPEGTNMGLSCGNPAAIAELKQGQVVLDLGSGGGFDVFLAGPKVGASGRVIGVDMTPEMISKARKNTAAYRAGTGLNNVEFRLGEIEHLPVSDASVDVVISNCVINLSPQKRQVWSEVARVLKSGGKVAASDMALLRPLPEAVRSRIDALIGCIAGAVSLDEYRSMVVESGLTEVVLVPKPEYVAALAEFKDPLYAQIAAILPAGTVAADFFTSVDVTARKPR